VSSRTGSGSTAMVAGCRLGSPCLAITLEILWAMSFTVRTFIKILQFDGDPELAFRGINDYRGDGWSGWRVLLRSISGWISFLLNSCSIHDDLNKPLHKILALRRFTGGRGIHQYG